MGISEARKRANDKYLKEKVEEFKVRVPKGKKDEIKAHAEAQGESTNAFINRAIDETMERDKAKD
ncbi:MAG: Arc family DNA-binding protein [Anaerotignum sp.]